MSANQRAAYAYAGATVLLWSTVASAFKLSLRRLAPLELLLWASVFSLVSLLGVIIWQGRWRSLDEIDAPALLRSALYGFLNPYLYYILIFVSYDLLPARQAQPLNYTWAVTLALLSVPLLGQRIGALGLAAILVSYAGAAVIATDGDPLSFRCSSPLGAALALGSTVVWAFYWIMNTRDRRDPVLGLALNFLFGVLYALPTVWFIHGLRWPDWSGLAGAAYVGCFEMGVTFVLWLKALKLSRTTAQVGNLIYLSPFLSLVFIHFLVGETIPLGAVAGLGLIIAGNLLQQLAARRSPTA